MKRIAGFALLVVLSLSWSISTKAQDNGVAAYARQSRKADKMAAKKQRKAMKKNLKAQRKAAKKHRHSR